MTSGSRSLTPAGLSAGAQPAGPRVHYAALEISHECPATLEAASERWKRGMLLVCCRAVQRQDSTVQRMCLVFPAQSWRHWFVRRIRQRHCDSMAAGRPNPGTQCATRNRLPVVCCACDGAFKAGMLRSREPYLPRSLLACHRCCADCCATLCPASKIRPCPCCVVPESVATMAREAFSVVIMILI